MAQPQRRAEFFVRPDGVCIPKALPLTPRQRLAIFDRDGDACLECGQPVKRFLGLRAVDAQVGAVDHIFPRARGGQNEPSNLRLLCTSCNASKGAA